MDSTFAEMNLAVFQGKDIGRVLWQPRLEYWYHINQRRGTLPSQMRNFSLFDVYDYCHASVRYFVRPLQQCYRATQVTEEWLDQTHLQKTFQTPNGVLQEVIHYDEYGYTSYRSEFKLKTLDDFRIYEALLQDEEWYWDQEIYDREVMAVDGRGAPQFYFRRSPIQGLFIEHMGFERTIYLMQDHPDVIERYVEVATAADEAMYKVLRNAPIAILNFGENIDAHMDPPAIWRKHLLPYYAKRNQQLKDAGKFTHIHIDGSMKPLRRLIAESPFEAIEACTPQPQGDVTLEEIKQALGERILLDGIPAIYFLPLYSMETLLDCVKRVIELFHPRLILGVSDELPPDSDIERVRIIGEMLETFHA
ncbi:MAG: hypothetical protein HY868_00065 [Chloroflexi bacterium]|nr:hypothetical protein [Chloroflexota bacterium]